MNVLVDVLQEEPWFAEALLGGARDRYIRGMEVVDLLEESERLRPFAAVQASGSVVFRLLMAAYVPLVGEQQWERLLDSVEASRAVSDEIEEFAVFVARPGGGQGFMLPDDEGERVRLSLFWEHIDRPGRVSLELAPSGQMSLSLTLANAHCSFPTADGCDAGACGRCRLMIRRAKGRPTGAVCRCPC